MNLSGYLVVKKLQRWKANARFVQKAPALDSNEIAIKVEVNLPDELFSRPQLKFKIDIPKEAVPQKEINAEVAGNIQQLIKDNMGIQLTIVAQGIDSI